jgi:hypothetical protein
MVFFVSGCSVIYELTIKIAGVIACCDHSSPMSSSATGSAQRAAR